MGAHSALWLLMPWCLSTRPSVAKVLTKYSNIGPVSNRNITFIGNNIRKWNNILKKNKKTNSCLSVKIYSPGKQNHLHVSLQLSISCLLLINLEARTSAATIPTYHKTSSISCTKYQNLNVSCLVLQLSLLNPLKPGRKWRCSWSSADRRCTNYIWVINNFIDY